MSSLSAVEPHRRLTLVAEMKMPGEALLDLQLAPTAAGRTKLRMISRFLPKGLGGLTYWYSLYQFHVWIFKGMLTAMARRRGMPNAHPALNDSTPMPGAPAHWTDQADLHERFVRLAHVVFTVCAQNFNVIGNYFF